MLQILMTPVSAELERLMLRLARASFSLVAFVTDPRHPEHKGRIALYDGPEIDRAKQIWSISEPTKRDVACVCTMIQRFHDEGEIEVYVDEADFCVFDRT